MTATALSVVVPTRDRPHQLSGCLDSLRSVLRTGDELIVVDSASADTSVAPTATSFGARLVRCDLPGASRARNAGVAAASHPLVAFVDDDVRVAPGWAAAMASALERDGVSFVCGRVAVPPDQTGGLRQIAIKDDPKPAPIDPDTPAPLGCSANLGVRGDVLATIGGFDEGLGGGARYRAAEDLDLFDRLLAAGFRGRYEPAALSWHDQWRSRPALVRLDWGYGIGLGARIAKLARTDRARLRMAMRESLWIDGFAVVVAAIRARHEFLVVTTAARLAGTVVGAAWAAPAGIRGGCFVPAQLGDPWGDTA